jgi:NAD+ synthase (glutamine-hydrolysing)
MNFRNIYEQGFARIAACTTTIELADPQANAETVLREARACADEGAAVALFPELNLTGYSIEDLLLQDPVLDAAEAAVDTVRKGSADLRCLVVFGAPLRLRDRVYNCAIVVHGGAVLGVVPKSYLPTYREFYERRQIAPGDDQRGAVRVAGEMVPFGPDLLFEATNLNGLVI